MSSVSSSSSSSSSSSDIKQRRSDTQTRKRKFSDSSLHSDSEQSEVGVANSGIEYTTEAKREVHSDDGSSDEQDEEEVKILSHKEQRRLKKKSAKESSAGAKGHDNDPKQKKGAKAQKSLKDEETRPKRQNSLWVGNLSYKTTSDALRAFFKEAGEVTRVHMPMQVSRRRDQEENEHKNRGYVAVTSSSSNVVLKSFSNLASHMLTSLLRMRKRQRLLSPRKT